MSLLKPLKRSSPCPCRSGASFGDCCEPFHRGAEPPTAEKLMRSRFSAYAAGNVDYILRTLHPNHADRAIPEEVLRSTIRKGMAAFRYLGLTVEEAREEGERAFVTFTAKIMKQAQDNSFRETSEFEKTAEGWRYLSGETLPVRAK